MKAVIQTGGKQYLVEKDQTLDIELVDNKNKIEFEPLLVFDGKDTKIGAPTVSGVKVTAEVVDEVKGDKIKIRKFQAKKRVNTLTGHRQKFTRIKITAIGAGPKPKPAAPKKKSTAKKTTSKK